ncbi:MAG TPA: ABC transporter permease [Candidatus Dojkabacteria bacterium]|nr:ABC transporter permease [Candidatus Dojkabacteria bacterium]
MRTKQNYIDLYKEFFITDFKLRYKHSLLGFFWVIIKPLSIFTVMYLIWSSVLKTGENFALYLLLGVITINFFNEAVTFGLQSLYIKTHIILKINFPREIVVFSAVTIATINFLINLGIFFIFAFINHLALTLPGVILAFLGIIALVMFILAISMFLSILGVKFHDIRHLVELLLQLIFWGTPVVYDVNVLPAKIRDVVNLNPLTHILVLLRGGLLNNPQMSDHLWGNALLILVLTLLFVIIGYAFFKNNIKRIAEYF